MASLRAVPITFQALRDRAFEARSFIIRKSNHRDSNQMESPKVELEFVSAIALVQIAQELNEIKYLLSSEVKRET